jgi:hypothetical protein
MRRKEPGKRTGIQERGQTCKDEEEVRRMGRKGRTSVDGEWMDWMERRNEETVILITMMCRL